MTIAPKTIPTGMRASPTDFPVHWSKPSDAKFFWKFCPDHFPQPIKPLAEPFCRGVLSDPEDRLADPRP